MYGPEPSMGLSIGTIKSAITASASEQHMSEWMTMDGLSHSKGVIRNITTGWRRTFLSQERNNIRLITGALTRMKPTIDPKCRGGENSVESMKRLLCDCDTLVRKRMSVLGQAYRKPEDFPSFPLGSIVAIMSLRRTNTGRGRYKRSHWVEVSLC